MRRQSLLAYIVRRVLIAAVTLALVATAIFIIFFALPHSGGHRPPGGVSPTAVLLAGRNATLAQMRQIDAALGLNRPLYQQIGSYLFRLLHGDLGFSYAAGVPVSRLVEPAIPPTLSIAVGASLVWVAAGIAIGTVSARRRGTAWDRVTMMLAWAGQSIPVFVLALLALAFLFKYTGIYAGNRYVGLTRNPVGWLEAMWLPWLCLAFPLIAIYARVVRGSMLQVEQEDYMKTAVAKGLGEKQVLKHQLRAGLTPVVTMYGLDLGILIGGSIIIEQIFNIPGLGKLLLASRSFYDFPLMSAIVMLGSTAIILGNLVVDILYSVLDPRVELSARQ
ncbi:MAG: peptide/nickel transport system permease protein [Actinomycetota bacterium]|jgi:peptide/nickel transport system permease protein|nr:peptide/nickel transport system permease protein [Actinomycetota bacterium]